MTGAGPHGRTHWLFPLLAGLLFAAVALGAGNERPLVSAVLQIALVPILFGAVFAAVHHAEVIAARTGEPYGTLVLTMAVTVIEVALITSLLLKPDASPALARDTVFAVIMIVCNGIVGLCALLGGWRHGEVGFRVKGASAYLAVLAPLATLSLVLPNYTLAEPGPVYAASQLAFVSLVTLALYAAFLFTQTIRHRDYFTDGVSGPGAEPPPPHAVAWSAALLLASLVGVIALAKTFAAAVEAGTERVGAPPAAAGVIVAILILLPEGVAAVAAAGRDQLQKSINLALGSSIATIGLTIPAVAVVATVLGTRLVLGLEARDMILLALTLLVSVVTFSGGRMNILFGIVHLVVFATYLFLVLVP